MALRNTKNPWLRRSAIVFSLPFAPVVSLGWYLGWYFGQAVMEWLDSLRSLPSAVSRDWKGGRTD